MDKTPLVMVTVRFYFKVKSRLFGDEMTKAQNSSLIIAFIFRYLEGFKLAIRKILDSS